MRATSEQLSPEALARIKSVRDLKSLYRVYPQLRRGGRPSGFKISAGPLERMAWCREQARRCELDLLSVSTEPAEPSARAESLRAALTDLRAVVRPAALGHYLSGPETTLRPLLTAIDALLDDATATYPPASLHELAPPSPA